MTVRRLVVEKGSQVDRLKQHLQAALTWANEHRKATAVIVAFIVGLVLGKLI